MPLMDSTLVEPQVLLVLGNQRDLSVGLQLDLLFLRALEPGLPEAYLFRASVGAQAPSQPAGTLPFDKGFPGARLGLTTRCPHAPGMFPIKARGL